MMLTLIQTELLKLRTVRWPWVLLLAQVGLVVLGVSGYAIARGDQPIDARMALTHVGLTSLLTLVLGIVASIFATPVAGCHVGAACPDLAIATIVSPKDRGAPLPTVRFHWSLDLTVYSFTEVPISLSAEDLSPKASR